MKTLRSFLKIFLGAVFLPPLIYLVLVIVGAAIPVNGDSDPTKPFTEIFLVSNGIHTDFVLPLKNELVNWTEVVKPVHTLSPPQDARYVSFGWGDLGFYKNTPQWQDLELQTAFNALFLQTPSAMHVRFLSGTPKGEDIRTVALNRPEYEKLSLYIKNSFSFDPQGDVQLIKNLHYTRDDAFYKAKGSLHLFKTCNTWVNTGLKEAELEACLWTPFVEGIFLRYPSD